MAMPTQEPEILYVTDMIGVHDIRFLEALAGCSSRIWVLSLGSRDLAQANPHVVDEDTSVLLQSYDAADPSLNNAAPLKLPTVSDVLEMVAPDLVQVGPICSLTLQASQLAKCPVLVTSWGWDLLLPAPGSQEEACAKQMLSNATALLVDSRAVAVKATDLGFRGRLLEFPWGVDLNDFAYSPVQASQLPIRFLSLRRHEKLYRVDVVVQAFALALEQVQPNGAHLSVYGEGRETPDLYDLATSLDIQAHVSWYPSVAESEVAAVIRSHHVLLSASPVDGSSVSMLQGFAVGRPSVCVLNDSNALWLGNSDSGFMYESGNVEQLSEIVLTYCKHPELVLSQGRHGRLQVEGKADWTKHRIEFQSWVRETVSGIRKAHG
jgi:glycosyltransferase involved in cell wall biosynthesis